MQTRARYISVIGALLRREGLRVASGNAVSFTKRARLMLYQQLASALKGAMTPFKQSKTSESSLRLGGQLGVGWMALSELRLELALEGGGRRVDVFGNSDWFS